MAAYSSPAERRAASIDLARAAVLLERGEGAPIERVAAHIECALSLGQRGFWEMEMAHYGAALAIDVRADDPSLDDGDAGLAGARWAITNNLAELECHWMCALYLVGDAEGQHGRSVEARAVIASALESGLPPEWRPELEAVRVLVDALLGEDVAAAADDAVEGLEAGTPFAGVALLAGALTRRRGQPVVAAGLTERAIAALADSDLIFEYDVALYLAVELEADRAATETTGLRLARHHHRREWESRVANQVSMQALMAADRMGAERDSFELDARVDELTGIANRRGYHRYNAAAQRRPGDGLGLLVIDVDRFKAINDASGHDAGDRALQRVSAVIAGQARAGDLAARMGGDEFVLVLAAVTPAAARRRAEQIVAALGRPGRDGDQDEIAVSIGVALGTVGELEAMARRADAALYQAKAAGGRRVVVAGPGPAPQGNTGGLYDPGAPSVNGMLTAKGISIDRGGQTILDDVSVSVGPATRLGVVGPNGIGKSTLLRVLAGLVAPDRGTVERTPADLTTGYLAQEPDAGPDEALIDYLARRTGVAEAGSELDRLTAALGEDPSALDAYTDGLERYLALGGDDFEARAGAVCAEVGLPGDRLGLPVRDLSGGQAARARLAAVLLSRFDVLLLDEPTNDLDFDGLGRLEEFLRSTPAAVVTVSHDRAFLDRSVDRILEIEEHTHRGAEFAGAWSEFVERRALRRSQARAAYEESRAERSRLTARIRTQRSWSEQGVRAAVKRPKDNDKAQRGFRVNRTEKQASKVRQSERALARLGQLDKPWEGWQLHLDLAPVARSGDVVARLDQAEVRRGDWRLGPVDVEIGWAERVAIMGPNGGGKSTLLAALLGHLPLDAGRRWVGPSVRFGELDQRRSQMDPGTPLAAAFMATTGVLAEEARGVLAKFGLTAEHALRPVGRLSPGERTRAQLAALMVTQTNCLVLDEPTNHLDLPAIEQLESALEDFAGTLLVVTHDRWLLETLRFDRTIEIRDGRVVSPISGGGRGAAAAVGSRRP